MEKSQYAKEVGFTRTGGIVVHHRNFNGLVNSPENLEALTFREHQALHARLAEVSGESNPRYSGHTVDDLRSHAITLTRLLGQRFSAKQWQNYAAENGLPQHFSEYRKGQLGSIMDLAKWAAIACGIDYSDVDLRTVRLLKSMLEMGYDAEIIDGTVMVKRICENCGDYFAAEHNHREAAYCSNACTLKVIAPSNEIYDKRISKMKDTYAERSIKTREDQVRIYSQLKFDLGRKPQLTEWEAACKDQGVSYRLRSKNVFKTFKELATAGDNYNHKVVSVEKLFTRFVTRTKFSIAAEKPSKKLSRKLLSLPSSIQK